MDDLDRKLIGLLRANARASVASLANQLKVARGTVQNRIAKLERDGTIAGYTLRLKPQVDEHRIAALMTITVEGNNADAVLRALRGDPAVQALHTTNGRWDIVAELVTDAERRAVEDRQRHGRPVRGMVTADGTRHVPRGRDAGSANMWAYWRDRGRRIAVRDACKLP